MPRTLGIAPALAFLSTFARPRSEPDTISPAVTYLHVGVLTESGREPAFFHHPTRPGLMRAVGTYLVRVWIERFPSEDLLDPEGRALICGERASLVGRASDIPQAYCLRTGAQFQADEIRLKDYGADGLSSRNAD